MAYVLLLVLAAVVGVGASAVAGWREACDMAMAATLARRSVGIPTEA